MKSPSEDAYRANNLGVALLEQFDYPAAVEAFRRAVALDPALGLARLNLAIALYNARDLPGALGEARLAAQALPDRPHPHYIQGLIAKAENRTDDAIAAFQRVVQMDAADVGGNVNLGQMYMQVRRYPEAIATFRAATQAEPYSQTAVYNLGIALTRAGERAEGEKVMDRFRELRDSGYRTVLGQNYLEQGRYAEALSSTGAEAELVSRETPAVTFGDVSAETLPAELRGGTGAGQVSLVDLDGDGALDLVAAGPAGLRIYRNDKGRFTSAGAALGAGPYAAVVGGDYDNDGKPDLLALGTNALALFHNEGELRFTDTTAVSSIGAPAIGARAVAFSDFDHDGDLDGVAGRLWRNNGNGTFADVTAAAGLGETGAPVAIVPTDFDNRRDVDLLISPATGPVRLFRNMRDGTFRDVAADVGLQSAAAAVAAGDVNKDDFTDFYLAPVDGPGVLALSDGRGRFTVAPGLPPVAGARASQFLDYDSDGLLDLLALTSGGPRLLRNAGAAWIDVSGSALAGAGAGDGAALASGDVDGDGDTDVILRLGSGGLRLLRNEGGNRNRSVRVRLAGQVSNRSSVGAKVEARAGSLRQKLETYAASPAPAPADVFFGLGSRPAADAVRVLWPAGILQTETSAAAAADGLPAKGGAPLSGATTITELDRKPSSCPYLYAWDGERFAFVTDFMGGGEMGYRHANGAFNHPDPDEYVRLTADQLRPRDGRLELKVTNELEEALFVDRMRLLAVAHPAAMEMHPYEGLVAARGGRPFRLYAAADAGPPLRAWDDHGHDVRARIERMDRTWPDDFRKLPVRGYAEDHGLMLEAGAGAELLLLTGWTDYAFSSDNVAAQQAGLALRPPSLQVKDAAGRWHTAIEEVGIPVGRPQTLVADLRGKWLGPSREVRIVTNMRIYWDRVQVARAAPEALATSTLEPATALLRWRGFSAELTPDGREPFAYEYARVSAHSPWKVFPGRYTREGDVRELLSATDEMFVISRPGDEIAVSFDASALSALPEGWTRTWLLYSDGYSKEMDLNSATPDAIEPLPFHAMSRYPYEAPESYPFTAERRAYIERYNTRVVTRPVPPLDTLVADQR